jgi:hypothetical protein
MGQEMCYVVPCESELWNFAVVQRKIQCMSDITANILLSECTTLQGSKIVL